MPNKVLNVQTRLTLRLRQFLSTMDRKTKKSLQGMGMLTTERTTAFLALALGDRKARTVKEMVERLGMDETNGTAYRAIRVARAAGVVKRVSGSRYKLVL
jgi:hypothetical protein